MDPSNICHVCNVMASRNPDKHQGLLSNPPSSQTKRCVLCARYFCKEHERKNESADPARPVCEIDHQEYYINHWTKIGGIHPSMDTYERYFGTGGGE